MFQLKQVEDRSKIGKVVLGDCLEVKPCKTLKAVKEGKPIGFCCLLTVSTFSYFYDSYYKKNDILLQCYE